MAIGNWKLSLSVRMQCLDVLEFFLDAGPRSAPVNMAMDEILLKKISRPLLRVYQWNRPAASFGYFEKYSAVEGEHAGRELVRRWTGGGVVLHGKDFTYSIMAPVDSPLFKSNAGESYRMIHEQIVETMRESGMRAWIASAASPKTSTACFENAVRHDILLDQQKIAGAAPAADPIRSFAPGKHSMRGSACKFRREARGKARCACHRKTAARRRAGSRRKTLRNEVWSRLVAEEILTVNSALRLRPRGSFAMPGARARRMTSSR